MSDDRHFARRARAAVEGRHLPSEGELLRGMPFMSSSISSDAHVYAARLLRHLQKKRRWDTKLFRQALEELTLVQDERTFRLLQLMADACAVTYRASGIPKGLPIEACQIRCQIYLAHLGDVPAAHSITSELVRMAFLDASNSGALNLAWRALGWAHVTSRLGLPGGRGIVNPRDGLTRALRNDMEVFRYAHEIELLGVGKTSNLEELDVVHVSLDKDSWRTDALVHPKDPQGGRGNPGFVMVLPVVGSTRTKSGKDVMGEFSDIAGKWLPCPRTPDLSIARKRLVDIAPHATTIVDKILADLHEQQFVAILPTILVGDPGCGKSFFAKAVAEALSLANVFVTCGGATDSALGGTSRRWASGEPCLPLNAVRLHRTAGPMIILDEVEKVSSDRRNGCLGDVLVGMLGDESARRYHDPYVEAEIDLAHVNWIMTANEVASLQSPLRDRCRILRFPQPGREHTATFANRFVVSHHVRKGHHPGWARPLDGTEIETLQAAWGGGSLRRLRRLVDGLIKAREQTMASV